MLTRSQIQRVAQRYGIGMQAQERDYIQHLLLFALYNRSQAVIFKGGTALRLVYRGNRYSEDLDFNGPTDLIQIKEIWGMAISELEAFGVVAHLRNPWDSEIGYSFDMSYQGPLYDGRDRTKGKVRVDINRRQEHVEIRRELVTPEYDDIRPFVVTVLTPEHMLAEKVRALLVRGKPRDAYDIWLMAKQGIRLRSDLVEAKLGLYGLALTSEGIKNALERSRMDWERDLRPLLVQYIDWEDIYPGISELINRVI